VSSLSRLALASCQSPCEPSLNSPPPGDAAVPGHALQDAHAALLGGLEAWATLARLEEVEQGGRKRIRKKQQTG
jgi:hypothetical protein